MEGGREEGRKRLGYAHLQKDGLADTEGRRKAVLYQLWGGTCASSLKNCRERHFCCLSHSTLSTVLWQPQKLFLRTPLSPSHPWTTSPWMRAQAPTSGAGWPGPANRGQGLLTSHSPTAPQSCVPRLALQYVTLLPRRSCYTGSPRLVTLICLQSAQLTPRSSEIPQIRHEHRL